MWDKNSQDRVPHADIGRIARIAVIIALGIIIVAIVSNQSVTIFMNVSEFGSTFTKPIYYSTISGIILAAISLVRVNVASRHSITWYGIRTLINFLKRNEYDSQPKPLRYTEYKMSRLSFAIWQLTKVVLFAPLLGNIMFGMAVEYMAHGNDLGLASVGNIFRIPFSDIPKDRSYSQQIVLPMLPALTLIVPPLIAAIGLRIFIYIGLSGTIHITSQYIMDAKESKPRFLSYISTIEIIVGTTVLWVGFTIFFSHVINFNTKYAILGTLSIGAALIVYGVLDRGRARVIIYPTKKHTYSRLLTIGALIIILGFIMAINSSIADSNKLDWISPYIFQEITVNRYMHDLDNVTEASLQQPPPKMLSMQQIERTVSDNNDILSNIRIWDEANAKARLDSEIESRNDIIYSDMNLLQFDSKMYWAASTAPKLPDNVPPGDQWFKQHIVYTHSDAGIKMIEADNGSMVDEDKFFPQQQIYYGKSDSDGIFSRYWSAFPTHRTESAELGHFIYNGTGGVNVSPPFSWMFEPTFMLSDPTATIHIMRYKEIHDRMELLYPYFVYQFGFGGTPTNPDFRDIEAFPVTDGKNTYWLMPLIALLDTSNVPWSSNTPSSFMLKLIGYALIDSYNGSIQVMVTGHDYFSNIFYEQYKDVGATREIPKWLGDQIKYPEEMIMWRVSKFNVYHVTDPEEFIDGKNFYVVPEDASKKGATSPSYVIDRPQGTQRLEYMAIQPLQFAQSKDVTSNSLAGYMVVQNGLQDLGKMTFYNTSPPWNSSAKLLGPSEAQNIVEKSKDYTDIKTLNRNSPLSGDNVLYSVGNYTVYFNALFVNNGAHKQVAAIAVAGSGPATGLPQVGIGETPSEAFKNYLQKVSGISPLSGSAQQQPSSMQIPTSGSNQTTSTNPLRTIRIEQLEKIFADAKLNVVRPTAIAAPVEFREATATFKADSDLENVQSSIQEFVNKFASPGGQIYEWQKSTAVNFGVLKQVNGVVENHYISIELEQ